MIDGGIDFGWRSFSSFKLCTVASVLQVENEITVSLSGCTSDPEIQGEEPELHVIEVTVDPAEPIDLVAGESVRFSLYIDVPWWTNKAFALHRLDDTLVLAGSSGNLVPGMSEYYAPADFAAPFSVEGVGNVCPPPERPPPPEPDCSFLECGGGCDPVAQREALAFSIKDGPTLQLMDHAASGFPGEPYSIVVSQAVQLHFLEMCADTANTWRVFVIMRH